MDLDDAQLTETGLAAPAGREGRVLVVACGALAREILALRDLNGWSHLDLQCLPAKLHLRPERIPDAVEAVVAEMRPRYARIFVAYADCGTGGLLAARCAALGVEMIEGPHCYSFFDGNAVFAARGDAEMTRLFPDGFPGAAVRRLRLAADGARPASGAARHDLRQLRAAGLSRADRRRGRSTPRPRAARPGSGSPTSGG